MRGIVQQTTNQGWKKPGFFYKKPNPVGFFNKTRVLLGFLGLMGFMGFSKKKNQKVLYGDSKIIFMC